MAIDNKVSIEIILDDGSVKRGFATIKKEAESAGKEIEKNVGGGVDDAALSVAGLRAAFAATGPIIAGIAAVAATAGVAIKQAFDLTTFGEQILGLRAQFDNLAATANLSGRDLRQRFEDVGDGLISIDDVLRSSTTRIAQLGSNAERLPDILDAARRIALATGQDVVQVYDGLANGIATGNARALRQFGIIVDLDKATKAYAASLGLGVEQLTEQQRQAVALNTSLNQVAQRFGNVDQSVIPLSTSLTRLRESANTAFGSISLAANELFGPGFQAVADAVTAALNRFNDSIKQSQGGLDSIQPRIRAISDEIERLQTLAAAPAVNPRLFSDLGGVDGVAQRIANLRGEIDLLKASEQELSDQQAIAAARRATEIFLADQAVLAEQRRTQASAEAREELTKRLAQEAALTAQIQQQTQVTEANSIRFGQASLDNLSAYETFTNGFKTLSAAIQAEARAQTLTYGDLAKTISGGFSTALASAGAAFASGANAAESFGNSVLKIIGQLAIQLGQFYIAAGIAQTASAFLFGSGAATIAAGSALVVLGGALQASAGSAIPTSSVSAGSSGGVGEFNPPDTNSLLPPSEGERTREPNTVINVNFEGDVIGDSADTGARIVSLINNAFDRQGVVLRQGVV